MSQSISFDRAAHFYDETRKLADPIAAAVTDAILLELRAVGAGKVLEIGIGTGRISRPLMEHGISVTGIDISRLMMQRLLDQLSAAHTPPSILFGDATRMPFRDAAFPAVLGAHVLHLVASATATVGEIHRVLRPGGVFVHQTHSDTGALNESWKKFGDLLKERGHGVPARSYFEEGGKALEESGASKVVHEIASEQIIYEPAKVLSDARAKIHSWTWRMPEGAFEDCFPEYEAWFRSHYGDRPIPEEVTYLLETWTWPGSVA
jgi:ubiquinone/menaquinone biosynthesis C-methylase UbiE